MLVCRFRGHRKQSRQKARHGLLVEQLDGARRANQVVTDEATVQWAGLSLNLLFAS